MRIPTVPVCTHATAFARDSQLAERNTRAVMWITVVMMGVEITAGWWFNSMALLADAITSILAIVALLGGWIYGWTWLDPVMGLAGAVLVAMWSRGLIGQTSRVLLDCEMTEIELQQPQAAATAG